MIIGSSISHRKFGRGVVADVNVPLTLDSTVSIIVRFDDDNYGTKKFAVTTVNNFFTDVDDDIIVLSNKVTAERAFAEKVKADERTKLLSSLVPCEVDEFDNSVSIESWLAAYSVAGTFRSQHESRAVVLNNNMIFINAASALRYIGSRAKDGDKLYAICEEGKSGRKRNWRYATKEDIKLNCLDK